MNSKLSFYPLLFTHIYQPVMWSDLQLENSPRRIASNKEPFLNSASASLIEANLITNHGDVHGLSFMKDGRVDTNDFFSITSQISKEMR